MDLHFNGPTVIGEIKDQKGSNIAIGMPGSVIQQTVPPEDQPQSDAATQPAEAQPRNAPKATRSKILLRQFKGNDVNFVRVIYALHKEGFFESENGGKPTLKDVFDAFGVAVNESIEDYSAILSNNRKDNTPETRALVFDRLKKAYLEYEQNIDCQKKERE